MKPVVSKLFIVSSIFLSLLSYAQGNLGTLPNGPIFVCGNSQFTINAINTVLCSDDMLAYILLDNSAGVPINYLAYNNTGVFNKADANYDETYYLFIVAGPDNDGDNLPDLDNGNTAFSNYSTEVVFIPPDSPWPEGYYCNEDTTNTAVINSCGNSAGIMSDAVFEVCFGDFAMAKTNSETIEYGNQLIYILHDSNSSDSLGNIITTNTTGIFHNDGALPFNQDLFVSAYVGSVDANGMPVLTDPCASVALPGAVLRFFKAIELVEVSQQCDVQTGAIDITFYLTGGIPEFPLPTPFSWNEEYAIVGDYFGVIDTSYQELTFTLYDVDAYEIEVVDNCGQFFLKDITCDTLNNVWPGDVNKNGFVNNEDIALLGIYIGEAGAARSAEDQNIDWYAHQASDWNVQQTNGNDVKHMDCNGDGIVNDLDLQAIQTWYGRKHIDFVMQDTVLTIDSFSYKILLQPIGEIINDSLVINIAMESEDSSSLNLQGAFFTIDYSNIIASFYSAQLNFLPSSWLGINNYNLYTFSKNVNYDKKIEAGFTKTDGTNSVGSGIIAQLILTFDSSSFCTPGTFNNTTAIKIHTAQANNMAGSLIPIENHLLQINNQTTTCKQGWQITKDTPFQNIYKTSGNIETVGDIIIGPQQQVSYKADHITINSGFKLKQGADFHVSSSDCDNGTVIDDPEK